MNHSATSKEELLAAGLRLENEAGLEAFNMRSIAASCGVSVGCVYHYFPSKAALLAATVEKVWESIFRQIDGYTAPEDFREYVRRLYDCIRNGSTEYPAFFAVHASVFSPEEKDEGRAVMNSYLHTILNGITKSFTSDPRVRPDAFDDSFTAEAFSAFLFQNLVGLAERQEGDCGYLIRLAEKLLY